MIHVPRKGPVPPSLDGPDSAAAREQRNNETALLQVPPGKPVFSVYRNDDVKDALNEIFHFKCAYCESDVRATEPGDVEHFRPKGEITVREPDGKVGKRPGYPWLAAEWSNLLLSCTFCNRPNKHQVRAFPKRTLGKANWFPLADEAKRALKPTAVAGEPRLLLDPCVDKPEKHLQFTADGDVRPRVVKGVPSPMGEATIETCGLARIGLMQARARHRRFVENAALDVRDALQAGRPPGRALQLLIDMLDPSSEYVAFTRAVLREQLGPLMRRLRLS